MQSATGEIPYGGRSNQFLHNETAYAAMCEFYATWMKERGDMAMASRFKAAAERAVASLDYWIRQPQVRHIKNRYPTDSGYGCESYAYFNKYMVTMGSWAFLAYCFADDAIPAAAKPEPASTFVTSAHFHRIVMNADGYTVQFDTNAQRIYDSSGIGRIQRAGAPPVLALACPCPADKGHLKLDVKHRGQLAISPLWKKYIIKEAKVRKVVLTDGGDAQWTTTLSRKGAKMIVRQKGDIVFTVPALVFDGESSPSVECSAHTLSISFNGWTCEYTTDGTFVDTEKIYGSRNGHLKRYEVRSTDKLVVKCKIFKNI